MRREFDSLQNLFFFAFFFAATHRFGPRMSALTSVAAAPDMRSYIASLRASVPSAQHLVLGNSSADLDSVVSALVFAAYATPPAVAVVACRRAEFRLRADSLLVLTTLLAPLSAADLTASLVFLDDDLTDLPAMAARGVQLTLVDHNRTTVALLPVVGVIDHHVDEGSVQGVPLRLVAPVGSCCTLVGQLLAHRIAADAAALLLWTIAADTLNFDAALRRATPLDVSVARFLHRVVAPSTTLADYCTAAFEAVARAKNDVSALSPAELLRRDYKSLLPEHSVGLASVPVPVTTLAEAELAAFCAERGVDSLVVFAALSEPVFARQLAVYSRDAALQRFFADQTLLDAPSPLLRRYAQTDVTASRKVIVPRLLAAIHSSPLP